MKKLLSWGGAGLLSTALLDPLIQAMLQQPVNWWRDLAMAIGGVGCLYLLVRYHKML